MAAILCISLLLVNRHKEERNARAHTYSQSNVKVIRVYALLKRILR